MPGTYAAKGDNPGVRTSRRYTAPRDFVTADGGWPAGPFQPGTPDYATATAELAGNIRVEMDAQGLSIRAAARAAGFSHATLINVLAGNVVPDLGTIRALETALDAALWPAYRQPPG